MYKIDYRFITKFMQVFFIAVFHILMRFGRDDFEICFIWCKHNCHIFVGAVFFVSLLLLLMLLLLLLLMLLLVLLQLFAFALFALLLISLLS